MKINYENYPVVYDVKSHRQPLLKNWYDAPVEYLTAPVLDRVLGIEYHNADILKRFVNTRGTCMFQPGPSSPYQIFYSIVNNKCEATLYVRNELKVKVETDFSKAVTNDCIINFITEYTERKQDVNDEKIQAFLKFLVRFLIFKQYGTHDIVVIANNIKHGYSKKKTIGNETYETDFKFPVKIIDSKFIRTLVRSGEFNVKGFFRFQACGTNWSDRKLVWIHEHRRQKHTLYKKVI